MLSELHKKDLLFHLQNTSALLSSSTFKRYYKTNKNVMLLAFLHHPSNLPSFKFSQLFLPISTTQIPEPRLYYYHKSGHLWVLGTWELSFQFLFNIKIETGGLEMPWTIWKGLHFSVILRDRSEAAKLLIRSQLEVANLQINSGWKTCKWLRKMPIFWLAQNITDISNVIVCWIW